MMTRTTPRINETLRNKEECKVEPNMRINSNRSWRRDMTDEIHTYVIVERIRDLRERLKKNRKDPGKEPVGYGPTQRNHH